MIDVQIKIEMDKVLRALDRVDDPRMPEQMAAYVAEQVVLPRLAKYPTRSGKSQPFVSDKQRRYFFAALRSGEIRVPYQRTHDLGSKWQTLPFAHGILLRSQMGYSEIVIGERQGAYFKNWPSVLRTARDAESDAALAASAFLVDKIRDVGA